MSLGASRYGRPRLVPEPIKALVDDCVQPWEFEDNEWDIGCCQCLVCYGFPVDHDRENEEEIAWEQHLRILDHEPSCLRGDGICDGSCDGLGEPFAAAA